MRKANEASGIVIRFYKLFRKACEYRQKIEDNPIGGPCFTIEIDETAMSRRKYKVGRITPTLWILGGICWETGECFMFTVPERKKKH